MISRAQLAATLYRARCKAARAADDAAADAERAAAAENERAAQRRRRERACTCKADRPRAVGPLISDAGKRKRVLKAIQAIEHEARHPRLRASRGKGCASWV